MLGAVDSSYFNTINESNLSVVTSLYLTIYESVLVVFIVYFLSFKQEIIVERPKVLKGSVAVYILFVAIALIVYLTFGRNLHIFEFALKSIGLGERPEEELDSYTLLIRQISSSGLLFSFLLIVDYCRIRYWRTLKSRYVSIALLFSGLMILIITGERRTSQIYTAFCTFWLLAKVFPSYKKRFVIGIVSVTAFVLIMMSVYKHLNAFLYDSYVEAIAQSNFDENFQASMFDAYFYGVKTVSKNIEFGAMSNLSVFNFLYDIARCTFGVNFFVPRSIYLTSEAYNLYMYSGEQTHGYLLSSIGYGYIYFGFLFAPFATFLNVFLLSYFEKKLKKSNSIEMTYIWAFIFMRFGFGFLGSIPPLVSLITRYAFFNGSLYLLARKMNGK